MHAPRTPTQTIVLLMGSVLLVVGFLALVFGSTDFHTGRDITTQTFIIWRANGWDCVIWMLLGAAGILASARYDAARTYAMAAGAFLIVVAIWGFVDGHHVFGLMGVDTTDNVSHAVLGVLGVAASLIPAPSRSRAPFGSGHPSGA